LIAHHHREPEAAMHLHHLDVVDADAGLLELGELLLEAAEADDKQAWDQLCIGAIGSGDCTTDQLESLVWGSVHPACTPRAQSLLVAWRMGSEEALHAWLENCLGQVAAALIKVGQPLGAAWSRAPGPLLILSEQAMQALEQQLAEELHECSDPLALIRPWLVVFGENTV